MPLFPLPRFHIIIQAISYIFVSKIVTVEIDTMAVDKVATYINNSIMETKGVSDSMAVMRQRDKSKTALHFDHI